MSNTKKAGRPAGSKNTGGNIVERMGEKVKNTTEFLTKLHERVVSWAEKEENEDQKASLVTLANDMNNIIEDIGDNVTAAFEKLSESNWVPSKAVSSGSIDYSVDRQVWIKPEKLPDYLAFGFTKKDLASLVVISTVKGRVMVGAKDNMKVRFPAPKLHLTVTDPSEDSVES